MVRYHDPVERGRGNKRPHGQEECDNAPVVEYLLAHWWLVFNVHYSLLAVTDRLRSCLVRCEPALDVTQSTETEAEGLVQEPRTALAEDIHLPGIYYRFWTEEEIHISFLKNVINPYILFFLKMTFNKS